MNNSDDKQFGQFLRDAISPTSKRELQQDLWPQMQLKLNDPGIRVRWFDLVLVAIVVILCISTPEAITGLLLNL